MLIVVLVWIVAGLAKPGFGSFGHLRYLLELAAVIGLVAIGQTYVVIAGGIDLSVGAIVTVSAVGVPLVALSATAPAPSPSSPSSPSRRRSAFSTGWASPICASIR